MNGEDPFGFVLEAGQVSKSQEELLGHQPLVGESLPSSDSEDHSLVAEERYGPSSPLLMISLPDSQDGVSTENTHQDLFHTPPEESAHELGASAINRTVQADTEMTDVGDSCGRYSGERPLVDLSKGSDLGVSEMEVVTGRTVTTEISLVGSSDMLLGNQLQLKDGLDDLTEQSLKFSGEIPKYSATGNVNAVADSMEKEVASAGNVSPSLPTVRDGNKQLFKGRSDVEKENVCGGSSGKKRALFVEKDSPGVRRRVRTRSEDEELKHFEVAKRVEAAENVERDAMEAENHQILRMLPMSLKTLPENQPSTTALDSEMKGSRLTVETGKLNRNSKVNVSAEEVPKENSVKWVENAVASDNQKLVSLPMPLLEWIKNTKKSLDSKKEGSVEQEGQTSSLLDLLKRVKAYTDDQEDTDEDDDDLDGLGLLHILKSRGVTYPRPRWWSDELYKKSKLKEFIN